jgi:hypothetical protein
MCTYVIRCELEIRKWNQILILLPYKGRLKFHVHNKQAVNRARDFLKSRRLVSFVLKMKVILHNKNRSVASQTWFQSRIRL